MSNKKYQYGVLNSVVHPQSGRTLDPSSQSGIASVTEAARKVNRPDFTEKLGFPLKGIALRVETNANGGTDHDDGWFTWAYNPDQEKPELVRVRVRIPELHAHLPELETYGKQGDPGVMAMYPVFLGKDQSVLPPIEGEVVYVDFGDRVRFEDPIYLGPVSAKPVNGGASSNRSTSASKAANDRDGGLNVNPPSGSPIGQSLELVLDPNGQSLELALEPNGQIPTPSAPSPKQASEVGFCSNTREPLENPTPDCGPFENTQPDKYRATYPTGKGTFKELGLIEMAEWVNRGSKNALVAASVKRSLEEMEQAFIKETSITDRDVIRFINDGFRSYEKQACYRAKYDECFKQWKRNGGSKEETPFPVARPGPGKHSSGLASDFNADGTGRGKKTRTTALWVWLARHSQRFGWVNVGMGLTPQEPWHYEFDPVLAKSKGY